MYFNAHNQLKVIAGVIANKIGVKFEESPSGGWYTNLDSKTIFYPKGLLLTDADIGVLIHEAAHLRFSSKCKQVISKYVEDNNLSGYREDIVGLINAFEDYRMNKLISELYQGAGDYLMAYNDEQFLEHYTRLNDVRWQRFNRSMTEWYEGWLENKKPYQFCSFWLFYFQLNEIDAQTYSTFLHHDVVKAIDDSYPFVKGQAPLIKTEEDLIKFCVDLLPYYLPLCKEETEEEKQKKEEQQKNQQQQKNDIDDLMKKLLEALMLGLKMAGGKQGQGGEPTQQSGQPQSMQGGGEPIQSNGQGNIPQQGTTVKIKVKSVDGDEVEKEGSMEKKNSPFDFDTSDINYDWSNNLSSNDILGKVFGMIDYSKSLMTIEELIEEVNRNYAKVSKSVSILKDKEAVRFAGNYQSGKLENRKLYKLSTGKTNIFSRRIVDADDNKDMAISLLIDESDSMNGDQIRTACVSATLLSKSLESAGRPFAIYSFNRKFTTRKEWSKKVNYSEMLKINNDMYDGDHEPKNGTNDAYAVMKAGKELSKRNERNKILIVISDGRPEPRHDKVPEGHTDDFDLRAEVRKVEKFAKVYSIGIQDHSVKSYYKNAVVVDDVKELGGILLDFFRNNTGRRTRV